MNIFSKLVIVIISTALFCAPVLAHEGHDHDGPSDFQPQKGGIVKSVEEINIEVVDKGAKIEIYFYDHDGKQKSADSFQATAEAKLPKGKKTEKLTMTPIADHFEITYAAPKGAHRYSLVLNIKDTKEAHSDKVTFTIETKKK